MTKLPLKLPRLIGYADRPLSRGLATPSSMGLPYGIRLSTTDVDDDQEAGALVATLSVEDGGGWTFELLDDGDGAFALSGSNLVVGVAGLDHDTAPAPEIKIRAVSATRTLSRTVTITVNEGGGGGPVFPALPAPVVMASLDVATTGTLNGTATLVSAVAGDEGTGKIALKPNGTSNAVSTVVTNVLNGDLSTAGTIALLVDYGQDSDSQTCTGVDKRLGRSGTYQAQSGISIRGANKTTTGKRWEVMQASELANALAIGAGQYDIRFQISQVAAYARAPTIDALVRNADGPAYFMLRMDDARVDQVRSTDGIVSLAEQHCPELVPFMVSYVPVSTLGDTATRMVGADLLNLQARGVKIASNLTPDDKPITDYASTADVMSAFQAQVTQLTSMGLGGPDLYDTVASNGVFRSPGAETQKTGLATTVGSAVVPMATTTDVAVGDVAVAVGLAAGTVVQSIDPGVSVTLSNPVTVASAFMTFINVTGAFHTNKMKTAAISGGIKSILSTNGGLVYVRGGLAEPDAYQLAFYSGSLATAATVIGYIDQAILRGCAMGFYLHLLDEALTSGLAMKPSEWVLVLQYLRAKYLAGLIRFGTVRTIRETYGEGARWPLAA